MEAGAVRDFGNQAVGLGGRRAWFNECEVVERSHYSRIHWNELLVVVGDIVTDHLTHSGSSDRFCLIQPQSGAGVYSPSR